ncbi:uncharacterized protein [Typha latifolia]|uniref:uncharacterized protein n=1 Tax=Typha latifolia TaxID=4733 RepID=UPI003C30D60F
MVQRKAPSKLGSMPKSKKEEVKPGRGDDARKKMKELRSMKKWNGLPNYMKPTSSSDARKEQLQVINHLPGNLKSLSQLKASLSSARVLKKKPSLKPVRPSLKKNIGRFVCPKLHVNRATCSSTLKDSKLPKGLNLNPGGTEAEGTSAKKVCPYTYCSLNGHRHDPLPALKSFLSSRRRMIKTQQRMKLKGLSPFRKKHPGKDDKETDIPAQLIKIPSGLKVTTLIEEAVCDFFVEIYSKHKEEVGEIKDVICGNTVTIDCSERGGEEGGVALDEQHQPSSDMFSEDGVDQASDLSIEEIDEMTKFLEYVSCDQELGKDNDGLAKSETKLANFTVCNFDCIEHIDPFRDNDSEDGDDPDAGFHFEPDSILVAWEITEDGVELTREAHEQFADYCKLTSGTFELDVPEGNKWSNPSKMQRSDQIDSKENTSNVHSDGEAFEPVDVEGNDISMKMEITACKLEDTTEEDEADVACLAFSGMSLREDDCIDSNAKFSNQSIRMIITRKSLTEQSQHMKDFDPRSPRLLPLEPDPEAETVDLRHQMVDERKNAEEWMIDYALQKAVTKLAPDRKRKVALLVEAFETVLPLPMYDKSMQHESTSFTQARPIQACN